jgi:hypothetical protein
LSHATGTGAITTGPRHRHHCRDRGRRNWRAQPWCRTRIRRKLRMHPLRPKRKQRRLFL